MDDRTTIAKDVLCALVKQDFGFNMHADTLAVAAAKRADALLAELARTAKPTPQPAPAPARGVPVWRLMRDKPKNDETVLIWDGFHFCPACYRNDHWTWFGSGHHMTGKPGYRWLDLNGYTPEVGE